MSLKKKKGYKWQVISISAGGAIVLSDRATTNVRLCARGKKKKRRKTKQKKKNGGSRIAILWTRGENAVLITAICPGYLTWTNWVLNSTSYIQGYNSEKLRPGLSLRLRQYIPLIAFVDTGLSVSFSPSSLNTLLGGGGVKEKCSPFVLLPFHIDRPPASYCPMLMLLLMLKRNNVMPPTELPVK